jgi:hypothetical protein
MNIHVHESWVDNYDRCLCICYLRWTSDCCPNICLVQLHQFSLFTCIYTVGCATRIDCWLLVLLFEHPTRPHACTACCLWSDSTRESWRSKQNQNLFWYIIYKMVKTFLCFWGARTKSELGAPNNHSTSIGKFIFDTLLKKVVKTVVISLHQNIICNHKCVDGLIICNFLLN